MHLAQALCTAFLVFGFPMTLFFRNGVNAVNAAAFTSDTATSTPPPMSMLTTSKSSTFDIYSELFYFVIGGGNFTAPRSKLAITTTTPLEKENPRGKRSNEEMIVLVGMLDGMPPEVVALLTDGGNRSTLVDNFSSFYPRVGDDLAYTCTINSFSSFVLSKKRFENMKECREIDRLIESYKVVCIVHNESVVFQGFLNSLQFFADLLCTNSSERFVALSNDLLDCKAILRESDEGEMKKKFSDKCTSDLSSEEAVCKALFCCAVDQLVVALDKNCDSRSTQSHADRYRLFRVVQFFFTVLGSHGGIGKTCGSMIIP